MSDLMVSVYLCLPQQHIDRLAMLISTVHLFRLSLAQLHTTETLCLMGASQLSTSLTEDGQGFSSCNVVF
jgi:hypothetical protein